MIFLKVYTQNSVRFPAEALEIEDKRCPYMFITRTTFFNLEKRYQRYVVHVGMSNIDGHLVSICRRVGVS